jgi:3' terminal RNA ribose 2'-O-methyltransferase Hen1
MLLTISTDRKPATDLGWLLHKRPDRFQSFELSFGRAHVFYPEATAERTTAALLLDLDTVGLVRNRDGAGDFLLGQYVNDRPYVASSCLSVAIAQVLRSAMAGRCDDRPELVGDALPLTARIDVLPSRGGVELPRRLFEPLGYAVQATRHPLDDAFPEWGESPYFSVTLSATKTLAELLTHIYMLVPVFDNQKHYYIGDDELEKLLSRGEGWLAEHPEKQLITRRYLGRRTSLVREALARLVEEERNDEAEEQLEPGREETLERSASLHEQRHGTVIAALRAAGARSVVDLGCGEGRLMRALIEDRTFERVAGMDVSTRSLEIAARRLKLDRLSEREAERVKLFQGSLTYRDERIKGYDAATLVEVIEHLDPPRLAALERVVFEAARPAMVLVTTPNREYNVVWPTLPAGEFRHGDHRFEWTRAEFEAWGNGVASRHGYDARYVPVGPAHPDHGAPSQMGVFRRREGGAA